MILSNISTQFCTPSYWSQPVQATTQLPDLAVEDINLTGVPLLLTSDILNTTAFESMISSGYVLEQNSSSLAELSAPAITALAEWFALGGLDLASERVNMQGFILGIYNLTKNSFDDLFDPATAAKAIEEAHQLLFSVAAAAMLAQSPTAAFTLVTGTITRKLLAVKIIHPFDYIMQGLLATTALCSTFLALYYWRRKSGLTADLSTLRDIGTMQIDVPFRHLESVLESDASARFELRNKGGTPFIHVSTSSTASQALNIPSLQVPSRKASAVDWSFYLKPLAGTGLVTVLVAIMSTLIVLQRQSITSNGLQIPWQSSVVQQIVLNYLPTLVATFLEPFWTLLNRMLCILEPFEKLRSPRSAKGSISIDARYTSLPPPLTMIRALRNRHFGVAGICLVVLSANALAVSMNVLFLKTDTAFSYAAELRYAKQNTFQNVTQLGVQVPAGVETNVEYQDHSYLANMNLTESAAMPTWTTKDHFVLPLLFAGNDTTRDPIFIVNSQGVAISTDCQELGIPTNDGGFQIWSSVDDSSGESYEGSSAVTMNISMLVKSDNDQMNCSTTQTLDMPINGSTAFEMTTALNGSDSRCGQYVSVMYARNLNVSFVNSGNATNQTNPSSAALSYSVIQGSSQTFMLCNTSLTTNMYASQLKNTGEILSSELFDSITADLPSVFQSQADVNTLASKILSLNTAMPSIIGVPARLAKHGHHTTISPQWMTYLMAQYDNSTETIDPSEAAPAASKLGPLVAATNAQLGALLIHLQMDMLFPPAASSSVADIDSRGAAFPSGSYEIVVPRLFFNSWMFAISIGLLAMNLVVAILFYVCAPRRLSTRIPTTIYDQLQLFRGSSVGKDGGTHTAQEQYAYGRYLGLDGDSSIGIEKASFVRPASEKV